MAPVFLLLAAVSVFAVPEYKDLIHYRDDKEEGYIIGGVPAAIEEFPFIVSLWNTITMESNTIVAFQCGGSIITEDWVLTAAHCLDEHSPIGMVVQLTHVRAGSTNSDKGGIVRRVLETVSHEFPPHDIGLIKVDEPWPFNGKTISLARLPRQDDPVPVRSPATIMGWGFIDLQDTPTVVLMKGEVMVISRDLCNITRMFWTSKEVHDKEMCTMFDPMKTPSMAWRGDSGSPVVVNGEVVGVVSKGRPYYEIPNIHAQVSSYIDWIEENVGPLPSAK